MDPEIASILKGLATVAGVAIFGGGAIAFILWLTEPSDAKNAQYWHARDQELQRQFEERLRRSNEGR